MSVDPGLDEGQPVRMTTSNEGTGGFSMSKYTIISTLVLLALIGVGCGSSETTTTVTEQAEVETTTSSTTEDETTEETSSELPDCKGEFRDNGDEGKCVEAESGNVFKVANRSSKLGLQELDVSIETVETADVLNDVGLEKANGIYLIFGLSVTNKLDVPVPFAGSFAGDQVLYTTREGNSYTPDFDASNGGDTDSFVWQAEDIQPGNSQSGTVIFDVPKKAAKAVDSDGNLAVVNFSDADRRRARLPVGVIRTYEG